MHNPAADASLGLQQQATLLLNWTMFHVSFVLFPMIHHQAYLVWWLWLLIRTYLDLATSEKLFPYCEFLFLPLSTYCLEHSIAQHSIAWRVICEGMSWVKNYGAVIGVSVTVAFLKGGHNARFCRVLWVSCPSLSEPFWRHLLHFAVTAQNRSNRQGNGSLHSTLEALCKT